MVNRPEYQSGERKRAAEAPAHGHRPAAKKSGSLSSTTQKGELIRQRPAHAGLMGGKIQTETLPGPRRAKIEEFERVLVATHKLRNANGSKRSNTCSFHR